MNEKVLDKTIRPAFSIFGIDYINALSKLSAILLSIGSYLTSFYGARLYVSNNIPAAFLLSTGFQLGIFIFSHGTAKVFDERKEKVSKLICILAFFPCLVFSSYMSTLGTYAVLRPSVEIGNERASLQERLHTASYSLDQLRTSALGYLNEKLEDTERQVLEQKRRLLTARKPYTRALAQRELDKLSLKLSEQKHARDAVNDIEPIGETMPGTNEDAGARLDTARANASSILAVMPTEFREANQLPQTEVAPIPPSDIQGSYIQELRGKSPAAIFCLAFALLLDLTSILIIRSRIPTPVLPERIRNARRYWKDIRTARTEPLDIYTQSLRIVVSNYPDLNINLELGSENKDLFPEDLKPHFEYLEKRIGEDLGLNVRISRIMSSLGMELLSGLPLKSQLDADNTVYLVTETIAERTMT